MPGLEFSLLCSTQVKQSLEVMLEKTSEGIMVRLSAGKEVKRLM